MYVCFAAVATPGMTNGKWSEKVKMAGGRRRVKRVVDIVVGRGGMSESDTSELMSVEVRSRQSCGLGKVAHMMMMNEK